MSFTVDFNTADANDKILTLTKGVKAIALAADSAAKNLHQVVTTLNNTKSMTEKLKQAKQGLENTGTSAEITAKKLGRVQSEAVKMNRAFDDKKMSKMQSEALKMNKAFDKTTKASKRLSTGISEVGKASKLAAQRAAAFRAGMNALGTHMGIFTGQTIVTAAAVYSVVRAFKGMVVIGAEFETQMVRATTIMGSTAGQAKVLQSQVEFLGATTIFTSTEVAGGLEALAMAGLSSVQSLDALAPSLELASIGQIDMYKSADILTNVMNGFRLTSEDIPSIVDDLATAVTSSNATITQMANALSYVAPVARAAGGSIEEVTAILQVFHNAGIKGSRAGTALRRAYSNLMKPSTDAKAALDRLGISTKDSSGYLLEMSDVMKQLADSGALTSDIIALFGVRAAPAMLALLQDMKGVSSEFEVFRKNLENNAGASNEMQKSLENALGADTKKMISALQAQSNALFAELNSGFRSAVQSATEFISSVSPETIKNIATGFKVVGEGILGVAEGVAFLVKWFVKIAVVAVPTAAAIAAIGSAMYMSIMGASGLSIAVTGLTTVILGAAKAVKVLTLAALANPFVALATAVVAVGSAMVYFASETDGSTEASEKNLKVRQKAELAAMREKLRVEDLTKAYKEQKKFARFQVENGTGGRQLDARDKQFEKELKELDDKIASKKEQLAKATAEKNQHIDKVAYDTTIQLMDNFTQQIKDAQERRAKVYKEYDVKQKTGLDAQGIRQRQDVDAAIAAYQVQSLEDILETKAEGLADKLQNLKDTRDLSAVDIFLGSVEEVEANGTAVEAAIAKQMTDINKKINTLKRDSFGNIIDVEQYKSLSFELYDTVKLWESANKGNAESLREVNQQLLAVNEATNNSITSAEKNLAKLIRENDELNGLATSVRSVAHAKSELALVEALLDAESLRGAGRDAEAAAMQAKAERLGELITLTYTYEQANKKLKDKKSKGSPESESAKIKKDYASGKGISGDLKAELEYQEGVLQLNKYVNEGLLTSKEELNEQLRALDLERIESQNEVAFSLAESMSKMVGDNIAQAVTMQETWHDTGDAIKKAILGGIVGALVQKGSAMAANSILHSVLSTKEVAEDALVTTAKVTGEGLKASAIATTATVEETAGAAGLAGTVTAMGTLMTTGTAMMAVFGPLAMMVSLATGGTNSIGAIAGIAATSAAMLTATAVTTLASVAGGIASGAAGGTREIGGPVSAGGSYLVGERGAEIFTPTTGGAITSNADVKRSLGQGVEGEVHNHYYETTENTIYANDALSFQQQLTRSKGHIANLNRKENRRMAKV